MAEAVVYMLEVIEIYEYNGSAPACHFGFIDKLGKILFAAHTVVKTGKEIGERLLLDLALVQPSVGNIIERIEHRRRSVDPLDPLVHKVEPSALFGIIDLEGTVYGILEIALGNDVPEFTFLPVRTEGIGVHPVGKENLACGLLSQIYAASHIIEDLGYGCGISGDCAVHKSCTDYALNDPYGIARKPYLVHGPVASVLLHDKTCDKGSFPVLPYKEGIAHQRKNVILPYSVKFGLLIQ